MHRHFPAALALCLTGVLLSGCAGAAPVASGQATLTYTATGLERDALGKPLGVGSLTLNTRPDFCRGQRRPLGEVQRVSVDRPTATLSIPAGRPLIVQSFWSAADQHCLLGDLAFQAEPGARYRMITEVDRRRGSCRVRVERREAGGYRPIGQLQSLRQICR